MREHRICIRSIFITQTEAEGNTLSKTQKTLDLLLEIPIKISVFRQC
ncbi:hypothetical protein SAMN05421827_11857 [Pedobacter terrae]|uniref:Uncharacterized protein n=1 Tax=Pedobacter terrae TaxID=405671 RepID=A0A1G8ABM8_9SPHI|nr:hypothetical protein SAMN05421827_11857 [Pedobacter terrae]